MATILEQLEQYTPDDRPAAVVHAMRQLARRAGHDLVIISQLAHEAHKGGYWSKVSRLNGQPYLSESEFFAEVLQVNSWRSAIKRIRIGAYLESLPVETRTSMTERIGDIGVAKAAILAPILEEKPEAFERWLGRAEKVNVEDLQAAVSDARNAKPRGAAHPSVPRDRVLAFLMNVMPDLDSRELLKDFIAAGKKIQAGDTTVGILIAAMQECVAQWSPLKEKANETGSADETDEASFDLGEAPEVAP